LPSSVDNGDRLLTSNFLDERDRLQRAGWRSGNVIARRDLTVAKKRVAADEGRITSTVPTRCGQSRFPEAAIPA
jgi:hypothetical protein